MLAQSSRSAYCASNTRRGRLRRGEPSSARTWSSIVRQCFTAASATLFVMTAQGLQTNTAAVCGWKDCWQRQQEREGRAAEEDIFWQRCMWRVGQKIQYLSVVLSIFSYVSTHLKIFVFFGVLYVQTCNAVVSQTQAWRECRAARNSCSTDCDWESKTG